MISNINVRGKFLASEIQSRDGQMADFTRFRDETSQEHKIQGWLETIICILNMKPSNSGAGLEAENVMLSKSTTI